jgi:hypothetical protein
LNLISSYDFWSLFENNFNWIKFEDLKKKVDFSAFKSHLTQIGSGNGGVSNYDSGSSFNDANGNFSSASNSNAHPSQLSSSGSYHFHQIPIKSNTHTYNNRCRSPSPGLFQDFDLFNFSSDTLFSTHCFEDQRDPVGTNPDLFQPDLLHLYPNFLDFGDVDSFGFNDFSSTSNTAGLLTTPNQLKLTQYPSVTHSPKIIGKQINRSISSPFNPPTLNKIEITNHQQQQHQHQHQQSLNQPEHISRRNLQNSSKLKSIINNNNSTLESSPSSSSSSSSSPSQSKQQQQQQQAAGFSVDSYYNFNTLATVAAASPSISPARSSQLNQLEELMPSTSTLTSNRSNTTTTVTNSTIRNLLALNSSSLVKEINQSSLKEMLTSTEKPNLIADNTNNNNPQIRDLLNSSILSPKNSDKIHGHHHHHHHHHQNQHQSQVVTQSSKKRGRKSNSTKAAEEAAAAAAAAAGACPANPVP